MFRRCHTFVTLVSETTQQSHGSTTPINMAAINPRLIHDVSHLCPLHPFFNPTRASLLQFHVFSGWKLPNAAPTTPPLWGTPLPISLPPWQYPLPQNVRLFFPHCLSKTPISPQLMPTRALGDGEAPTLWPRDVKNQVIGKDPDAGKDRRQKEKREAKDEMVR